MREEPKKERKIDEEKERKRAKDILNVAENARKRANKTRTHDIKMERKKINKNYIVRAYFRALNCSQVSIFFISRYDIR